MMNNPAFNFIAALRAAMRLQQNLVGLAIMDPPASAPNTQATLDQMKADRVAIDGFIQAMETHLNGLS